MMREISFRFLAGLIEKKLQSIGAGRFQEFCLIFLPLYNPLYDGLQLWGGTIDGKTRKGTPDLIKTFENGKQIAVQCSDQESYWDIPKDRAKWKPCEDIDKCIEKPNDIQEIVLCSSQDMPTSSPNIESEILFYAKSKLDAKITVLSSAKICDFLLRNIETPSFSYLFKTYFPEIHGLVELLKEKESLKLAVEVYKERPVPLTILLDITKEATKSIVDIDKAKSYVLRRIDELKSRFERFPLPSPGKILRVIPKDYPLINPIGKIYSLLGVPRIGKTSLVAQFEGIWNLSNILIRWFECSEAENEQEFLVKDILRNIWACFVSPEMATELSEGIIKAHSFNLNNLRYNLERPIVFVLDNSELLSDNSIKLLCGVLVKFKNYGLLSQIGFVFISNRGLKHLCPVLFTEFPAFEWSENELKEFLTDQLPDATHYRDDKYMEILKTFSGGHPPIALALARKFSSLQQLVFSRFKGPSLGDEDLTDEMKGFLFEDLLKDDADSLSYVLRLSVLTLRFNNKIIDAVGRSVKPPIAKPFSLVLDKLYGTVIEGDEKQGYSISFVYKEVAKKQLSLASQKEIYDVVSLALLRPEGNVLNAIEVTDGIFYSILAYNFERAAYWTTVLLQSAINKNLSKPQVRNIVNRLDIVAFIKPPHDLSALPLHYMALLSITMAYSHVGDYEKANKVLDNIKEPPAECGDQGLRDILVIINEATKLYRVLLMAISDPVKSMDVLSNIEFEKLKKMPINRVDIAGLFEGLTSAVPLSQIPKDFLEKTINFVDKGDEKAIVNLLKIAMNLGVKAANEGVNLEKVVSLLPSRGILTEILELVLKAQYTLQKEDPNNALKLIEQAIILCQKEKLLSNSVEIIFNQLKGDSYYKLVNSEKARESYGRCVTCSEKNGKDFDYAWANYRLGLLSTDSTEAERYFREASTIFSLIGYDELLARSEGERGTALVQLNKPLGFVRIVEWLCRRYYLRNKSKFAPAVTVALAQLTRLISEIKSEPVPEEAGKTYPKFERGVYAKVLEIASPQAGGTVALYSLARCYALLKDSNRRIRCLRTALRFKDYGQLDSNSVPLVIYELLEEIVPVGDKEEIGSLMTRGFFIESYQLILSHISDPKDFISHCIFSPLDKTIEKMDDSQKQKFIEILDEVHKTVTDSDCNYKEWWLASVCLRKARIGEVHYKNKDEKYYLWKKAFESGIKSNNEEVIIQSGHCLGFFYCDRYSIKELAEIQFNLIKAIPLQKEGSGRIEKIGQDLFKTWRRLDFVKLSEYDLDAKHALMDGARTLNNSGLLVEEAAPIMILLLLSIYRFKGDAVDWAVKRIKELGIANKIPKNVKDKIVS